MNSGNCSKFKVGKRLLRTFNLEVALYRASDRASDKTTFSNDLHGHLQAAIAFVKSFEGEQFKTWNAMHVLPNATRRALHYCRHVLGDVGTKGAPGIPGKLKVDELLASLRGNSLPDTIGTWGDSRYSSKAA